MNWIQGTEPDILTQTTPALCTLLAYVFCLLHSVKTGTLAIAGDEESALSK